MTTEDKQEYCRQYYNKTKGERPHEYSLVSRRAFLRKQIRLLGLDNLIKTAALQKQGDAITAELKPIRQARWAAKRAAGGALFKHFSDDEAASSRCLRDHSKDLAHTINEVPSAMQ